MDYFELEKTSIALNTLINGSALLNCGQIDHRILRFSLGGLSLDTDRNQLVINFQAGQSGVYLSNQKPKKQDETLLARSFKNKTKHAHIQSIKMPYPDRFLVISLALSEWRNPRELWIEFKGNRSNIVLVDRDTRVIYECLSKFPDEENLHPVRMPGRLFEPGWERKNNQIILLDKLDVILNHLKKISEEKQKYRWLLNNVAPMTPDLARKTIHLFNKNEWELLKNHTQEVLNRNIDELANPKAAAEYLFSRSTEKTISQKEVSLHSEINDLNRQIGKLIQRNKKTLNALFRDLEKLPDPMEIQKKADSLAAVFHTLKKGMESITVENLFDPASEPFLLSLNPDKSPKYNLDRLYQKVAKAKRAEPKVRQRITVIEKELSALKDIQARLQSTETPDCFNSIKNELAEAGVSTEGTKQKTAKPMITVKPFLRFKAPGGYIILVGRSAQENDRLTFQDARPNDFWFHAMGFKGAHVVVKNNTKSTSLPDHIEKAACQIAVYYSKARGEKSVPVFMTLKKHVRKAAGNKPGLAIVSRHETCVTDACGIPDSVIQIN